MRSAPSIDVARSAELFNQLMLRGGRRQVAAGSLHHCPQGIARAAKTARGPRVRALAAVFLPMVGFALLGLSYGQAAGAVTANFPSHYRYTGAAFTSDLAWLVGAGFAPLVALGVSSQFGLAYVGLYLLSGAVCTLGALRLNKALEARD